MEKGSNTLYRTKAKPLSMDVQEIISNAPNPERIITNIWQTLLHYYETKNYEYPLWSKKAISQPNRITTIWSNGRPLLSTNVQGNPTCTSAAFTARTILNNMPVQEPSHPPSLAGSGSGGSNYVAWLTNLWRKNKKRTWPILWLHLHCYANATNINTKKIQHAQYKRFIKEEKDKLSPDLIENVS